MQKATGKADHCIGGGMKLGTPILSRIQLSVLVCPWFPAAAWAQKFESAAPGSGLDQNKTKK